MSESYQQNSLENQGFEENNLFEQKKKEILEQIQSQNTQEVIEKLPEIISLQKHTKESFLLLSFIESYFYSNNLEIPEILLLKTQEIASAIGRPPTLTYQAIILDNVDQEFTFTKWETAKHEKLFYETHVKIEIALKPVVDLLIKLLETREFSESNLEKLKLSIDNLKEAVKTIQHLNKNFSPEEFAKFRHYFSTHPVHKLAGASGLYSAAFPTLDYLLQEELPAHKFQLELLPTSQTDECYTTREDLLKAMELRKSNSTIVKHCNNEYKKVIEEILIEIQKFRQNHRGAVKKNIPQVFEGKEQGTGGLDNRVNYLDSVIETIKQNRKNI